MEINKIILILLLILAIPTVSAGKIIYPLFVIGDSMQPALYGPEIVSVNTINGNDAMVGDVVCFNYDKRDYIHSSATYICHRVINKNETHVCTKGDNCKHTDPCVKNNWVALKILI